jgi:PhzF family phenazine biosynthesis protein
MKLWTVDAFTDKPFKGNPAAIALVDNFLSDSMSRELAAEINLPETGFVKPLGQDHYHIRWFTPKVEVELCGHGTLAAAHILYQENLIKDNKITFESLYGQLFVKKEGNYITLDFPLIKVESSPYSKESLEDLLGIKSITHCFVTRDTVIAELSDEVELRNLNLDPEKIRQIEHVGLVVTTKGLAPYDFVSRVFGPKKGTNEDPVTGSVHCLLADYWQQKLGKTEFLAYQASPRGGEMSIKILGNRVLLKGQAITITEGNLKIF